MSKRPTPVGALLRVTPPDRLPEVAAEHLRRHHCAGRVEVLLGDLSLTALRPLIEPDGPHGNALAQRCFRSQRPVADIASGRHRAYLPLSAWGERVGVLVVETPLPADSGLIEELSTVADELAVALRAADVATDRYRRAQRHERLTMAAELQWELLPGRSLGDDRFLLAGQLEPAYAVFGDHYDWSLAGDRLTVTVLNGHGDGLEAAVLTTVAVNAMRNARRSGANIVEQAELASDAVYARFGGAGHAATLLLEIDLVDGRVEAVDAGSPRAVIARDREIQPVTLEQQLPLGMFGETRYETQKFSLQPADRLLVVSDGVHAATPGGRSPYGESALLTALRRTRLQPATEAVGTVMRNLREYHGGVEPEDDAVTVCLDWRR
ncbi:PP2C family protein-serine/threonine phosphatase [Couchioplanes caeruleus]|uniref:Protein phosphatase n=2 Tax=Couchioplanes caeruleus TaxID=56438 RepID=A0A1K0GTK1_9ACTN|nr:PP2C family protein-serine/threonine phosphatase [Couchioplanes caeruleus]OJF14612.1 protein phosphatase [Couchioplanes caeruleus subsp. caeruleus]ROP33127.1 serine phosphatase RsbU (regulator of sigma subunit) [Couchioplanes caeruleus]